MALVGLFFIFVFLLPSVSLAIPPDGNGGAPPVIPLDPRVNLPPSGLPAAPDPAAPKAPVAPGDPVVVENPTVVTDTNFVWLRKALHEFVVTTFGVLLSGFGDFFDYAVDNFVIGFGDKYINSGTGFVIDELWGIIRNIFNLTLIFGLVYIGFQMILGLNNSAQRSIGYLVAAALLVNFSLFITKFVVDFSNQAATQIYQAMVPKDGGTITTTFTNAMSLSGIMSVPGGNYGTIPLGYIFGILLIFVVTAFVFAAGGIMLLLRYIGLNLYLVFSPLLFLGWVFPSMSGYSKKYWSGFLGKAFFAPAFIFMLYLSIRVINGYGTITGTNPAEIFNFNPGAQPGITSLGTFSFFIMVIGFLLASLVVAQKMGATGASTAIAVGQRMRKGAQGIITGGGANMARWGLDKISTNDGDDKNRGKLNRGLRFVGRGIGRTATTFGARTALESAAKPYTTLIEKGKKERGGLATRDAVATAEAEIAAGLKSKTELDENSEAMTREVRDKHEKAVHKMQMAVADLGTAQLENMSNKERVKIAAMLTSSQVENMMKSDKINESDKGAIIGERKNAIEKLVGQTGSIITSELSKLSINQIETMGDAWIRDNALLFTSGQMDDLKKSKKFTESQRNEFVTKRDNDFKEIEKGDESQFKKIMTTFDGTKDEPKHRKPAEIAQLPKGILLAKQSLKYINGSVLEQIFDKKSLSLEDRNKLRDSILENPEESPDAASYLHSPLGRRNWNLSEPEAHSSSDKKPYQPFSPKGSVNTKRPIR